MKQKFDYKNALERMCNGAVTSNDNGKYDYYKIDNGTLYGFFSCDDELFEVDSTEQEKIKNSAWYLVSRGFWS